MSLLYIGSGSSFTYAAMLSCLVSAVLKGDSDSVGRTVLYTNPRVTGSLPGSPRFLAHVTVSLDKTLKVEPYAP